MLPENRFFDVYDKSDRADGYINSVAGVCDITTYQVALGGNLEHFKNVKYEKQYYAWTSFSKESFDSRFIIKNRPKPKKITLRELYG